MISAAVACTLVGSSAVSNAGNGLSLESIIGKDNSLVQDARGDPALRKLVALLHHTPNSLVPRPTSQLGVDYLIGSCIK